MAGEADTRGVLAGASKRVVSRTPRPRYYLMKWHADWVRKYGVDGFRADTAKHVEPAVWAGKGSFG